MFSRNSASSRAIPFEKMVKMVEEDPFIPIAWQKQHVGMQGNEYFNDEDLLRVDIGDEFEYREDYQPAPEEFKIRWLEARDKAITVAISMDKLGLTKQLCNRILEPFMWHTTLVTFTEIANFLELRCPKIYHAADGKYYKSLKDWNNVDKEIQWNGLTCLHPENKSQAEIHIQALAEAMWDAMNESTPRKLEEGEWHIPRFI